MQAGYLSCRPSNNVKALKELKLVHIRELKISLNVVQIMGTTTTERSATCQVTTTMVTTQMHMATMVGDMVEATFTNPMAADDRQASILMLQFFVSFFSKLFSA